MKKLLFLSIIYLSFASQVRGQETDRETVLENTRKMGFVAYLTQIKYEAEFKMSTLVNNTEYIKQKEKASQMNANYNMLKLTIDKLINQMSADLYNRNFLKLYRRTNKYIQIGKELPDKFKQYKLILTEIESLRETLFLKTYSSAMAGPTYAELFSGGTLLLNAINSNRDFRRKKVESIVNMLNSLKLDDIVNLKQTK